MMQTTLATRWPLTCSRWAISCAVKASGCRNSSNAIPRRCRSSRIQVAVAMGTSVVVKVDLQSDKPRGQLLAIEDMTAVDLQGDCRLKAHRLRGPTWAWELA